jgi:selenocysteine-specific elongation factor
MSALGDERPLVLGTAGHIDHGKTVLVEALTGVNTDRLPAERERGISIELGFAELELPSGRHMSVVDAPGHERFVRTMVAGATGIDLFLLVVAADDGVMPQTREHLAVLTTLGVPSGVVALTKADIAGARGVAVAREDVVALLAGTPYESSPVVAVSTPLGEGTEELRIEIDRAAASIPDGRVMNGPARLHVDRSFTLRGIGTVVTGTLWSGEIGAGETVSVEPRGLKTRVRSVQVHDRPRERARAGQRVALNLAGVAREDVQRGDVVTAGGGLRATYLVDTEVALLPSAARLEPGTRVHLHHGTRETPARVAPLEGAAVEPGARAFAQLRLERAIVPAAGDRFVLRQVAPQDTIGGGTVIDPSPRKHGPGAAHIERLRALVSGDPIERLAAALELALSGVAPDDADAGLLERLREAGRAFRAGETRVRYFSPDRFDEARERIASALAASARPLSRGALADAAGLDEPGAGALLETLVSEGRARRLGPGYVAAGAREEAEDSVRAPVLALLEEDGLEPRSPEALAKALALAPPAVGEALDHLALEGRVVRVRPGMYYGQDALVRARESVIALCERDSAVTIASLRDALATSRKYAQALLEYFDGERLTRRQGDQHVLRRRL